MIIPQWLNSISFDLLGMNEVNLLSDGAGFQALRIRGVFGTGRGLGFIEPGQHVPWDWTGSDSSSPRSMTGMANVMLVPLAGGRCGRPRPARARS
jgi:hypothetical protein